MPSSKVLIVSPNVQLAFTLEVLLREHGFEVRSEGSSKEASGAIKEFAPDVLLTACEDTVFVGRRNASEIEELSRPVDTEALLRLLRESSVE